VLKKGDKVIVFKRKEEKDTKEKWSQTVFTHCNRRYYCSRCKSPKKEAVAANTEEAPV
jgi:hypothetical protein